QCAVQQSLQPRGFIGKVGPQDIAASRQAVARDQDLVGMPVCGQPIAVFIDEHDAPGQLVESAQCGVSLDLEIHQAAPHSKRALQMRQERSTTLNVGVTESVGFARAQDFEKYGGLLFFGEHCAKSVMQILRLQPFSVESTPYKFMFWYELLAGMDGSWKLGGGFARQP